MKNAALATLASLAFHMALAAIFAAASAERSGHDTESARLDLSKMDFSLSSEECDTMPEAAPALPQTPARRSAPPPAAEQPLEPPPARNAEAVPKDSEQPEPDESRYAAEMTAPPAPAPKQARMDAPPRPKSSIRPEYPAGARARGEQGGVTLEIAVSPDGTVSEIETVASSGFAALDDAAVKAVRRARFLPAKSDGRPVAGRVRLTLEFRLKGHRRDTAAGITER